MNKWEPLQFTIGIYFAAAMGFFFGIFIGMELRLGEAYDRWVRAKIEELFRKVGL
jgi:hypothetical protein